eukprot:Protomagalhaensia_sp_Gyna_25__3697@NODE_331_length_3848_cov_15_007614_g258_i0_p1_GENE_NODE_331_length_3848_cov_15_007614_g258_i0NODE_331_length_3848_cov_15_007614_g258_i0_p1_ORF_typecomplete_len265_score32_37Exonuc_VII_L/PF02601_15/0_35_NODE_331_length_3848_cov_15_007614_g258_i010751869
MFGSTCSIQSEGAWTVDEIPISGHHHLHQHQHHHTQKPSHPSHHPATVIVSEIAPPPASSIPSPSFLSTTASTPSPAVAASMMETSAAQLAQALRQCAALLSESATNCVASPSAGLAADENSLSILRTLIAQEVEKQVQLRQQMAALSPIATAGSARNSSQQQPTDCCYKEATPLREAPMFLPSNLIQGLNLSPPSFPPTFNPAEHGWISPKAGDHDANTTSTDGTTPAFANAVRGMFNNVAPQSPSGDSTDWAASTMTWKLSF